VVSPIAKVLLAPSFMSATAHDPFAPNMPLTSDGYLCGTMLGVHAPKVLLFASVSATASMSVMAPYSFGVALATGTPSLMAAGGSLGQRKAVIHVSVASLFRTEGGF
jgi:hypothetical protein